MTEVIHLTPGAVPKVPPPSQPGLVGASAVIAKGIVDGVLRGDPFGTLSLPSLGFLKDGRPQARFVGLRPAHVRTGALQQRGA